MRGILQADSHVKSAELHAVVIRCRCGDPDSHKGEVCPHGVSDDLGCVASMHTRKPATWWQIFKLRLRRR